MLQDVLASQLASVVEGQAIEQAFGRTLGVRSVLAGDLCLGPGSLDPLIMASL
jgi:hypothetical protein